MRLFISFLQIFVLSMWLKLLDLSILRAVFFNLYGLLFAAASITDDDAEFELHAAMRSLIVVTVTMKQRCLHPLFLFI